MYNKVIRGSNYTYSWDFSEWPSRPFLSESVTNIWLSPVQPEPRSRINGLKLKLYNIINGPRGTAESRRNLPVSPILDEFVISTWNSWITTTTLLEVQRASQAKQGLKKNFRKWVARLSSLIPSLSWTNGSSSYLCSTYSPRLTNSSCYGYS